MTRAQGALKHLLADAHDMVQHTPLHQLLWIELVFQSCVFFSPTCPISNHVRVCHGTLCVFPVDVINTHTH